MLTHEGGEAVERIDAVAGEEPLEIRLLLGGETRTVAITMRTPGSDFELATGFLFGEGVISRGAEVSEISYCVDRDIGEEQRYNIVNVKLAPGVLPDLRPLERHFFTSSACGVCGKASLEALAIRRQPLSDRVFWILRPSSSCRRDCAPLKEFSMPPAACTRRLSSTHPGTSSCSGRMSAVTTLWTS